MPPLSILQLNSARKWIGEAAHTIALAKGLGERGHRVVVGVRSGYELEARARAEGLDVAPFRFKSRFNGIDDWRDVRDLRRLIRRTEIDIVHCHRGKDHWIAAGARALPGLSGLRLVRTRHVVTPMRRHVANRWLFRSGVDGVLAVSRAAKESLGDLMDELPPSKKRIILSAVDAHRFRPELRSQEVRRRLGAGTETVLIGLVGRIQRVKGQRQFLKAAAEVAAMHPNALFLIAGRGSEGQRQALFEYAEARGLPREQLRIVGVLDDLPPTLASLDIGVAASVGSEGSSRITLEYMASGLPIVATRVGGIPDIVEANRTGRLVAPKDASGMAEALNELLQSPERRRQLGQAARSAAVEKFTLDRWLNEIETFYFELVRGRSEHANPPASCV